MLAMLADSLWGSSDEDFIKELSRWDDSRLFFFLSCCCERHWWSEPRSGPQVSSEWGCPPVPSRLRGDLICLSSTGDVLFIFIFYGCHLVEEGGLHWWQTGLFNIIGCFLSLPHQSLMIPPYPPAKDNQHHCHASRKSKIFGLVICCHQTLV